jgi:hypothetical protein
MTLFLKKKRHFFPPKFGKNSDHNIDPQVSSPPVGIFQCSKQNKKSFFHLSPNFLFESRKYATEAKCCYTLTGQRGMPPFVCVLPFQFTFKLDGLLEFPTTFRPLSVSFISRRLKFFCPPPLQKN